MWGGVEKGVPAHTSGCGPHVPSVHQVVQPSGGCRLSEGREPSTPVEESKRMDAPNCIPITWHPTVRERERKGGSTSNPPACEHLRRILTAKD
jgi:hypothetical protein